MRRPLKPFVTEYKQSNRRNHSSPNEQGTFENERPAPKLFDTGLKEPEDSYEAAMRAADALFSPAPDADAGGVGKVTTTRAGGVHGHEASSAPTKSALGSIGTDAQPPISSSALGPEKTGGRILRAIDEPPSPQYAALEAERAPKRRGRKPGSKNRPKVAAIPAEIASPAKPAVDMVAPMATTQPAVAQVAAITSAPNSSLRGANRFPWVRDRLKPGEDWKRRRLPRVCW